MIIKYSSAWVAIIVTCFLLIIVAVLGKQEQLRYQEDVRADVVNQLSQVRARLESEVNANLHLTKGLVSLVTAYPDFTPEEFEKAGQELLRGKTSVRNVGLAPNNVLNYIYPIEGNEMAIGLIYEDNPIQWPALAHAIERRKTILSGPLELVEGDIAFISLTPIWLEENDEDRYWGVASMVINADTLFSSAGVVQSELGIKLAIRGVDGLGADGAVFLGESMLFNDDPITMEATLPSGTWQLGATPKNGWSQSSFFITWLWIGGVIFSIAIGFFVFTWINSQTRQRRALTEAKQSAERANLAKSEFLSRMSHELRTPLHAILGFGELLSHDAANSLNKEQEEFVNHILRSGHHLLLLIDEVLDLARIDAGKYDLSIENFLLPDLIDECLTFTRLKATSNEIILSSEYLGDDNICVSADYMRLKQALLNLITNAIKYNQKGGKVMISCCHIPNDQVRISVTDTGIGIPKEKWHKLFQPFARLGAEELQIEGTGIGLTITKNLIEAMDGKIGFDSEMGVGTVFWIEIPGTVEGSAQFKHQDVEKVVEVGNYGNQCAKILYIEDNQINQKLMKQMMAQFPDIELLVEPNAELGLATAKRECPKLILMDINLPGMSGLDALGEIRRTKALAEIPVIAVSAASMNSDIERGMQAGFNAYITKPFNFQTVMKTIEDELRC